MEQLLELTDDEDFNELINIVINLKKITFRKRVDYLEKWTDLEFIQRFRLSKETVQLIKAELTPELESATMRNYALSPLQKVLLTLQFLATGSILQVVGDFSDVDKCTASRIIYRCCIAIARHMKANFINMPETEEEINSVRQGFFNISRFPRCIGALDGTHIPIQSPGGEQAELFRNRKFYFSYNNVQAICDSKLLFRNIVCRWQGSAADSNIFNNSRVKINIERGTYGQDSVLVADSGYAVMSFIMTPLLDPRTPAEHLYNESQIRTRNPIERCFGVWKRRFPVLSLGIKLKHHKVKAIVVAAAVLHNIAILQKDLLPSIDDEIEVEAAIQLGNINIPYRGLRVPENELARFSLINQYFQSLL